MPTDAPRSSRSACSRAGPVTKAVRPGASAALAGAAAGEAVSWVAMAVSSSSPLSAARTSWRACSGVAEQLSFVPFLGGYQGRVVADRGVAFDSLGEPQQGPDRQVPYSGNRSGYENVPKFMMVRGATSGPGLRDRGRTGGAGW